MKELFFVIYIAICSTDALAQSADTTTISIQATAQEICSGEQVTLSVRKTWAVGDILCTDGTAVKREEFTKSNKIAKGVIFWISPDETHGWAVHLQEKLFCQWAVKKGDIPDLPNINIDSFEERYADTAGYRNTKIIRESGTDTIFPAAYAVDFENGWYLPAARQILFLQLEIPELNKSLAIIPEAIIIEKAILYENNIYQAWKCWSSTEINETSVIIGDYLTCMSGIKDWPTPSIRTRAVCTFQIVKP